MPLDIITIITVGRETVNRKIVTLLITIGKVTVIIANTLVQCLKSEAMLVITTLVQCLKSGAMLTIGLIMITIITVKTDQRRMTDNILTTDLGQDLPRIPEFTQVNNMGIDKVNLNHILVATSPCQGPRMSYHAQIHLTRPLETIDLVVKIAAHPADVSLLTIEYTMIKKTR